MNNFFTLYYNQFINGSFSNWIYSMVCLLSFVLIYFIVSKILNNKIEDRFKRKKIKVNIRNFLLILLSFILISLWAGQIKTMLLSTAAITAAIIITFKEVILSFFASFYITSNKILAIGDEIEYENIKGRVVDRNLSGVKIQSNSIEENKIIFIPNIIFLTNKVMNFSKIEDFNLNLVSIGLKNPEQAIEFSKILEEKLIPLLNFNLDDYKANFSRIKAGDTHEIFTLDKNFYIKKELSDYIKIQLKVYFYAKKEDKEKIENKFFDIYYTFLKENSDGDKSIRSNS